MKRMKKHKVKREKPETSTSYFREQEEHDLAYYIHDRVELMHQVFSVLKYKELKAIAPECVRNISVGDLQELCTEELLGISSKRLCAILDGAEPPSDTESSSRSPSLELETISLDSISSDEEILSQGSNKKNKKHKHKHRDSKTKSKSKKSSKDQPSEDMEVSKASRAGLTVLELLELQARARAIRAQLQQEQAAKRASETAVAESTTSHHSSDNEVMIKEEPQEVVEISSEDEKPSIQELEKLETAINPSGSVTSTMQPTKATVTETNSQTVTKRINDLIITVPQTKPSRKIKLNRNSKVTVSVPNIPGNSENVTSSETRTIANVIEEVANNTKIVTEQCKGTLNKNEAAKSKSKKKQKRKKKNVIEKDGSDHDEITLQLSDSEKMDLLEDLDRKTYENVSSSVDSESSSSDSEDSSDCKSKGSQNIEADQVSSKNIYQNTNAEEQNDYKSNEATLRQNNEENDHKNTEELKEVENSSLFCQNNQESSDKQEKIDTVVANENDAIQTKLIDEEVTEYDSVTSSKTISSESDKIITKKAIEMASIGEIPTDGELQTTIEKSSETTEYLTMQKETIDTDNSNKNAVPCVFSKKKENETGSSNVTESARELSEGEVSDRESSEVEAVDLKPEVVCISDEEAIRSQKKKKKKDKKSKKEKKSKKSKSDFREGADQNFFKDSVEEVEIRDNHPLTTDNRKTTDSIDLDVEEVYEILELSDDSSCYEVEGTVLSKEPTAEEIEALSAKIDEIEREEVITEEQIREHERLEAEKEKNNEYIESVSWKDRYLDSKKVKRVLTTSNIINALRKKNKELKKKLEESKMQEEIVIEKEVDKLSKENNLEEGSIEHFNTLQGSTKYVEPVPERMQEDNQNDKGDAKKNGEECNTTDGKVTKEMKKDAKQLLKMYRKLLKYNDMNKQKDPNKKKKKKAKKKKVKSE